MARNQYDKAVWRVIAKAEKRVSYYRMLRNCNTSMDEDSMQARAEYDAKAEAIQDFIQELLA